MNTDPSLAQNEISPSAYLIATPFVLLFGVAIARATMMMICGDA